MTPSRLQRRQALLKRLDAAFGRWPAPSPRERAVSPARTDPEFVKEMTTVVKELTGLAREVDSHETGDRLERSRNWRYVGNACFDLANARDMTWLQRAAKAYEKADALLEGTGDAEEKYKLEYAYGHALLHLSQGTDLARLEQARAHYASAVTTARTVSPPSASHIQTALNKAETLIARLRAGDSLAPGDEQVRKETAAAALPGPMKDDARLAARFGEMYTAALSAGKTSGTEQQALDPVVSQTQRLIQESADDLSARTVQISSLLDGARSVVGLQASQTGSTLSEGSRAAAVWQRFSALKLYVSQDVAQMIGESSDGPETRAAGIELVKRCASADAFVHQTGLDDQAVLGHERNALRQLASDVRAFSLRKHLTLISPRWPSPPLARDPSAVFFSGGEELRKSLLSVCADRGLKLPAPAAPHDFASTRWNELRACNVAVFDFTGYVPPRRSRGAQPGGSKEVAATSYELGLALALGRTAVVLAKTGQELPFDIDIPPVRLEGDSHDKERLAKAVNDAIYGLQRGGETSSIPSTRAYLNETFAGSKDLITECLLKLIDDDAARDSVKFRRMVEPLLGRVAPSPAQMVFPAWPGSYSRPDLRSCFHVTAFRPRWAGATRKIVAAACKAATPGIQYVRGDQVLEPNILRSIWDSLCQASHVVVDLTDLNPNVALELGIAHALGRNVLLVSQDKRRFRAIEKERTHAYSATESGLKTLGRVVARFLAH